MQNPFFLSMGVLFSLFICLGIVRMTLYFHKEWTLWKTNSKIRQVLFSCLTIFSALYIAIRFYYLSFQTEEPRLIFFDFIILLSLSTLFFLIKLSQTKKNKNKSIKPVICTGAAILGFEILSFILWLTHFSITANMFMTLFYCILFALTIPIFFFHEKDHKEESE